MSHSSILLACCFALGACVDVAFSDGGGGATGSSTAASGGAGGQSASTSVTGTGTGVGGSASGGAAAGGGGGGPACIPTTEVCNGIDDDCNGLTDQPPNNLAGEFCGCDWVFNPQGGGRAYVLCPTAGQSFDAVMCPGGTVKLVLQTSAEQTYVAGWLDAVLPAGASAYIGLRQTPGSTVDGGWAWLTSPSDPAGRVLSWAGGQPNDHDDLEPMLVEDSDQDCGVLRKEGAAQLPNLQDADCDADADYVVCEAASPQPCAAGGSCLLPLGCQGVFDCSLPTGQECVPAPASEECNGRDDNCDGQVDVTAASSVHACGCVSNTNPATSRDYKMCSVSRPFPDAECGPGYKLVVINDAAEQTYIAGLIGGADMLIGLYQLNDAVTPDTRWFWPDGLALAATSWETSEPADGDGVEDDTRNCAHSRDTGWHDAQCTTPHAYICEELEP